MKDNEKLDDESLAFQSGRQAGRDGVKVGDNPYHEDSNEHWEWMAGWVTQKTINLSYTCRQPQPLSACRVKTMRKRLARMQQVAASANSNTPISVPQGADHGAVGNSESNEVRHG